MRGEAPAFKKFIISGFIILKFGGMEISRGTSLARSTIAFLLHKIPLPYHTTVSPTSTLQEYCTPTVRSSYCSRKKEKKYQVVGK